MELAGGTASCMVYFPTASAGDIDTQRRFVAARVA